MARIEGEQHGDAGRVREMAGACRQRAARSRLDRRRRRFGSLEPRVAGDRRARCLALARAGRGDRRAFGCGTRRKDGGTGAGPRAPRDVRPDDAASRKPPRAAPRRSTCDDRQPRPGGITAAPRQRRFPVPPGCCPRRCACRPRRRSRPRCAATPIAARHRAACRCWTAQATLRRERRPLPVPEAQPPPGDRTRHACAIAVEPKIFVAHGRPTSRHRSGGKRRFLAVSDEGERRQPV